jgi:hypothetical protein
MTVSRPTSEKRRRADRAGRLAETLCALSLRLRGYRILDRRFRTPVGELDIVARRGRALVFVEVNARQPRACRRIDRRPPTLPGRARRRRLSRPPPAAGAARCPLRCHARRPPPLAPPRRRRLAAMSRRVLLVQVGSTGIPSPLEGEGACFIASTQPPYPTSARDFPGVTSYFLPSKADIRRTGNI